jgi:hypothetical protein
MRARLIAVAIALASTLLCAEDFSLTQKGFGPITVHTTLTYEGKGERLVATAVNDSGQAIPYVRLCVTADMKSCLFQMWNTERWEPGKSLSWDVTTAHHLPTLAHQVKIGVLNLPPAAPTAPESAPEAPKPALVSQTSGDRLAPVGGNLELHVTIVDRQYSATRYTYVVPGYLRANSNSNINCSGGGSSVDCSASTRTTATQIPARAGGYEVQGATFSLQLPDGRVAVVNCAGKVLRNASTVLGGLGNAIGQMGSNPPPPRPTTPQVRSCRMPIVDHIQVEFSGDNAKLKWPVSIDGKKLESETYKILGVIDKP